MWAINNDSSKEYNLDLTHCEENVMCNLPVKSQHPYYNDRNVYITFHVVTAQFEAHCCLMGHC